MRVFVLTENGLPKNINCAVAWYGFREMGFEVVGYSQPSELEAATRSDIVVGGIGLCQLVMRRFGVEVPRINYPDTLKTYLGRRLWTSTINRVNNDVESWPVFVKPVQDKKFTGVVVRSTRDLIGCGTSGEDAEVICSEVVSFDSEWRCFVRYGEILDIRRYNGSWRRSFDPRVVEDMVAAYLDAPAGYAIDIGVTSRGETLLVEVNDGYALGSYGLQQNLYAQLLNARWSQLMGVEDELAYIGRHGLPD
ncbi:ATP-grasp domain-containing protein [Eggerthellaceae bacterium 3-80]|nr:DUF4343 domain-containing protein [bacterium D16-34]